MTQGAFVVQSHVLITMDCHVRKLTRNDGGGWGGELRLPRRFAPHNDTKGLCGAKRHKSGLPRREYAAHNDGGGWGGELRLSRRFAPRNDTKSKFTKF
jgi:hypothetical protein